MSVARPQKTAKGLGPPGSPEPADPCTESGERRARVVIAAVGSCKTLIRGFPGLPKDIGTMCGYGGQVPPSPPEQEASSKAVRGSPESRETPLRFPWFRIGGIRRQRQLGALDSRSSPDKGRQHPATRGDGLTRLSAPDRVVPLCGIALPADIGDTRCGIGVAHGLDPSPG
jgi:hypothetical protein